MIPLDLDLCALDRPAAAAAPLEFTGQGRQGCRVEGEAGDHRHRLAAVPLAFATDAHLAVTKGDGGFLALAACCRLTAAGAEATMFRGVDRAGV